MFASYFWNRFLDIFEIISNEHFWINFLGERTLMILKRYAGNDTILVCVFLSFIPAISQATKGLYLYCKRLKDEMFYVSVVIADNELIFTPVDEYVTKNFRGIDRLRHVRGKTGYADPVNQNQRPRFSYFGRRRPSSEENTPIIELIPEKYREFALKHKGYIIYVNRKDEAPSSENVRNPFLSIASMRTDTIEIKMRSRDLPKLRSFIQDWVDEYYNSRKNKLIIYKCNFNKYGWDDDNQWKEHGFRKIRSFNSVVLKKGEQERILNDILTFKESKEWYEDRGIPYRRGYLLHGPPGTGKTSFIQSLASRVKMNVAILNLSAAADDDSLSSALAQVPKNCILVIEDIDHYKFDEGLSEKKSDDKDSKKDNSVSVSGILNAIDGIASLEESIIFMTCNDMNTIPPALIRPGRVDLKLHMGYIDNYQAELIFWRFFCMGEKETELEKIPKEKYPVLANTVNELIQRIRDTANNVSKQRNIELEISPAELISYLLFHALKYKLSTSPQHLDSCCQSILDHIPDFIESIASDRKQAIEHAKKKAVFQQMQQPVADAASQSSAENTNAKETKIIPTPPTSPAAEKKTASDVDDDVEDVEQEQKTIED
ncbi:P-loop containing nucleoside triphosphate hydrolase protein [Parasitella parasitica]|nr:P-loop containing nucleoside triphosphate hydrolase protein [Parasitella parasitica]